MNKNAIKVVIGLVSIAGIAYVALTSDKKSVEDVIEKAERVFSDIPVNPSVSTPNMNRTKYIIHDICTGSGGPVSSAVKSIAKNAIGLDFDHNKVDSARRIAKIIKNSTSATDFDKGVAIEALSSIMNTCDFDHNKRSIMDLIDSII